MTDILYKVMAGVGGGKGDFLRYIDYFLLTFSLYEFFRSGHEYFFRITWGACEFVFVQFPLVRIFVLRPPSRHISFLMVCPYSC